MIREYKEDDKEKVNDFVNRLRFETYGSSSPSIKDLQDIKKSYFVFLIAEESGQIIGTCGLLKNQLVLAK